MQPLVLRAPAPRSGGASPRIRTRIAPGWVLPDQRTRTQEPQELALLRVTGAFKLLHSCPTHLFPSRRTRAMLWHPLGLPWPCHPLHGAGKCPDLAMVGAAAPLLGRDGKRAVMLGSINTECVTLIDRSRSESGGLAERGRACSARGCCHQGWGRATQDTGAALTQDTLRHALLEQNKSGRLRNVCTMVLSGFLTALVVRWCTCSR